MACEILESRSLLVADANAIAFNQPIESNTAWQHLTAIPPSPSGASSYLAVEDFAPWELNLNQLQSTLAAAPLEFSAMGTPPLSFAIPTPTGGLARFAIFNSPLMAPELAAEFPEIQTYAGQGLDDPAATVRLDVTPQGFHAQVLSPNGSYYVDPYYHLETSVYVSYSRESIDAAVRLAQMGGALGVDVVEQPAKSNLLLIGPQKFTDVPSAAKREITSAEESAAVLLASRKSTTTTAVEATSSAAEGTAEDGEFAALARPSGAQLRTFRAAVATTAEYTAFHGGTIPLGLTAVVTAINRVSGIYESELAIRLQLVVNNNLLIYTNPATDPYLNNDPDALLDQNQATIDARIGNANYDIGHVFSTGGGGLAAAGVGIAGEKALGETGSAEPIGDPFYVDYVAHEMGHQFSAEHSWSGSSGSCSTGNYAQVAGVEPGSGTTIMSYAGICGGDNLAAHSDPYFHAISFDEIIHYVDDVIPSVGTRTANGNSIPAVNAGPDYVIPLGTPFTLTASGSDANSGDVLTYAWEQLDGGGPQKGLAAGDNGVSAWFRSRPPTTSPARSFPRQSDLLNNAASVGDSLPIVARTMDFRVTARDNRAGGGGVNSDDMRLEFVNTGSPFRITEPNSASVHWAANSTQLVNWNVGGTTANRINTSLVNIRLSTDGGLTFPVTLAAGVPNDGSQLVEVPNLPSTSTSRILIEPVGNIYFDISDANFAIDAAVGTVDFGDAPDSYSTSLANNGARHTRGGPRLGAFVDGDASNSNPPGYADGLEEDGVAILSPFIAGQTALVRVVSSTNGAKLDCFFDFDGNGVFGNVANEVFSATLTPGAQTLSVAVPASASVGPTFARFRISTAGSLGPVGAAVDGEVEDYAVTIFATSLPSTSAMRPIRSALWRPMLGRGMPWVDCASEPRSMLSRMLLRMQLAPATAWMRMACDSRNC